MNESFIPMIRLRLMTSRNLGLEISYSYDYNISKLNYTNAGSTNEITLIFTLLKVNPEFVRRKEKWGNNKNGKMLCIIEEASIDSIKRINPFGK